MFFADCKSLLLSESSSFFRTGIWDELLMDPERGSGSVTKARGRSTMSTNKLLQSLSEDPQLEKQIGCMAGILQIFDRHQVLTGRRLYGHKRIAGM